MPKLGTGAWKTQSIMDLQPCLSVVIPCFNEEATVGEVLARVLASELTAEVVVVDDGSTDGTRGIVEEVAATDARVRLLVQPCNLGKGAALRRGFECATAPYVIVQDADLEYDPDEWPKLLGPLVDGRADVVYGSRFLTGEAHRVLYFWHAVGNRVLTLTSNAFTNLNLSDMETCYKVFRREVIQSIELREDRFGFEPEVTAKVARAGWRVYELAIGYSGRTYAEGKKIGWRDGVRAMWCIVRYSSVGDRVAPSPTDVVPGTFDASHDELEDTLETLDAAGYADWVMEQIEPHVKGRILDVGAGTGTMTTRLLRVGEVTAVEPAARLARQLLARFEDEPRVRVVHGTIDDVAPIAEYDSAVIINALEHVEDDRQLLRDVARRVRAGGSICVFVPAHEWLYSDYDRRIGHHRRYRKSSLAHTVAAAELELVQLEFVNLPGALAWLLGTRALRMSPSRRSVALYDRFVLRLTRLLERRWRPPFGQSLLAVLRVPPSLDG